MSNKIQIVCNHQNRITIRITKLYWQRLDLDQTELSKSINKVQINCNPQNRQRIQDLKSIKQSMLATQHEIEKIKFEIKILSKPESITENIEDIYHPPHGETQIFPDDPYHTNYLASF
jgi:hypothetical protein